MGRYPRGVTHAEVRDRLRAYADGTLDDAGAEVVRAHLASGCGECLRAVFTRRVGLPRVPVVEHRTPRRLLALALLAGLGIGAALGLSVGTVRRAAPPPHDAGVDRLAEEVARLRREREATEADARERLARLEARVERQGEPVAVAKPEAAPEPAPGDELPPDWLETLLASDGARLLPLQPAETAPGASGFAVWSRARGIVVVSASDLPVGSSDAVYRVRVTLNGGATVWAGDLPASERGTLVVTAPMPEGPGWRVTRVDLYRDPPNAPALTAHLRP
jgi:hypothetical protein